MQPRFLKSCPLAVLLVSASYVAIAQNTPVPETDATAAVATPVASEAAKPAAAEEAKPAAAEEAKPAAAEEAKPAAADAAKPAAAEEAKVPASPDGGDEPKLPNLLPDPNDPNAKIPPVPGKPAPGAVLGGDPLQLPFARILNPDGSEAPVNLAGVSLFADRRDKASEEAKQWEKEQKDALKPGVQITEGLMTPNPDGLRSDLGKYLGKVATFKDLQEMVRIIQEHYRKYNRPMTHVYIPRQSLYSDRVVISIVEGRIGQTLILTEADLNKKPGAQWKPAEKSFMDRMAKAKTWWNSWYNNPYKAEDVSAEFLPKTSQLEGRIVDTAEIEAQVTGMNRSPWVRLNRPVSHPFRDVAVNFSQPETNVVGRTNLIFEVDDKRPLKFFAGADNALTDITGGERIFLGGAWYDAFLLGRNHQLGAQVFSALNPDELFGFSFNYQIPWQDQKFDQFTELFTSYASSTAEVILGGIPTDSTGGSLIVGGRHYLELPGMLGASELTQPLGTLNPHKNWANASREAMGLHHEVGLGLDYKKSDNNLEFGGSTVAESPADIFQVVVEYNARQTDPTGETNLLTQFYISPGDVTDNNTDEAFAPLRRDAKAAYMYTRIRLERDQDLPFTGMFHGMMLRGALTAQYSSENLLASEQLGLGGFNSVRGYPERALRGDIGYILNLELFSPEFHPLSSWFKKGWFSSDTLKFLAFFDYGHGESSTESASDPLDDPADLMSVGVGVRYEFDDSLRLRLDYGFRMEDLPIAADNDDSSAVHFGLIYMF